MKYTQMLKKNYEFKNVLSKGKYYSGNNIEMFVKKNISSDNNLLGIAISVKIAKAVGRNRIKRLIREAYKNMEKDLKTGFCFVFLWKKKISIENASYDNIYQDMKVMFEKARVHED